VKPNTRGRIHSIRVVVEHGAIQSASQVLGFLSGVLIVRALDKTEYAQYSVVIAIIAAASVIADSGINATVMAIGGRVHGDSAATASLFSRAFRVRYVFGIPIVVLSCAWSSVLLAQNGLSWQGCVLLASIAAFTLLPTMAAGLLRVHYRLELRARYMQVVDIGAALLRLVVVLVGMALGVVSSSFLLFGGLLVSALVFVAFWRGARAGEMLRARPTENASEFWANIRRVLPMTVFLVASEQALLAIASFRGDPTIVAEMSALSRFAVAFVVLNAIVSDIIAPRFSRAPNQLSHLRKMVLGAFSAYFMVVVVFVFSVWLFSPLLLGLLGPGYAGLVFSLVLFAVGYGVANLAQAMNVISQARGWVHWSWTYIPLSIVTLFLCAFVLPLRSIDDVAVMFVLQCSPALVTQLARIAAGLSRVRAQGSPRRTA